MEVRDKLINDYLKSLEKSDRKKFELEYEPDEEIGMFHTLHYSQIRDNETVIDRLKFNDFDKLNEVLTIINDAYSIDMEEEPEDIYYLFFLCNPNDRPYLITVTCNPMQIQYLIKDPYNDFGMELEDNISEYEEWFIFEFRTESEAYECAKIMTSKSLDIK